MFMQLLTTSKAQLESVHILSDIWFTNTEWDLPPSLTLLRTMLPMALRLLHSNSLRRLHIGHHSRFVHDDLALDTGRIDHVSLDDFYRNCDQLLCEKNMRLFVFKSESHERTGGTCYNDKSFEGSASLIDAKSVEKTLLANGFETPWNHPSNWIVPTLRYGWFNPVDECVDKAKLHCVLYILSDEWIHFPYGEKKKVLDFRIGEIEAVYDMYLWWKDWLKASNMQPQM